MRWAFGLSRPAQLSQAPSIQKEPFPRKEWAAAEFQRVFLRRQLSFTAAPNRRLVWASRATSTSKRQASSGPRCNIRSASRLTGIKSSTWQNSLPLGSSGHWGQSRLQPYQFLDHKGFQERLAHWERRGALVQRAQLARPGQLAAAAARSW